LTQVEPMRRGRAGPGPGFIQKEPIVLSILGGFSAGLVHVVSGPDHLAAVGPLSIQPKQRACLTGVRWGLGHAGGVLAVGLASLFVREMLPVERISAWAEPLVGIVLVVIGLWGFGKALRTRLHAHEHAHDGEAHLHFHVHDHTSAHRPEAVASHAHTHAAFAVGVLHGIAGSSHFLGVLPALAFPTRFEAVSYLLAYGLGTIGAMASFSSLMSWLGRGLSAKGISAYRALAYSCSTAAVVIGCVWFFRTVNF
jgi:hypothetical protein